MKYEKRGKYTGNMFFCLEDLSLFTFETIIREK